MPKRSLVWEDSTGVWAGREVKREEAEARNITVGNPGGEHDGLAAEQVKCSCREVSAVAKREV